MWEYDRFTLEYVNINELVIYMNKLGSECWEIINFTETKPKKFGEKWEAIILAKRPKQ